MIKYYSFSTLAWIISNIMSDTQFVCKGACLIPDFDLKLQQ